MFCCTVIIISLIMAVQHKFVFALQSAVGTQGKTVIKLISQLRLIFNTHNDYWSSYMKQEQNKNCDNVIARKTCC